ncbi:hypothetical protein AKJ16_DCAP07884 [Drosera capensis]
MAVVVVGWSSAICEVSILLPKNGTIAIVVVGSTARGLMVCRILFHHLRSGLYCSSLHYYSGLPGLLSGLHFQRLMWLGCRLLCES